MTNNQHGQVPNKYLTVVYRDIAPGKEARELIEHPKMSASSWSHALNDRDAAIAQVSTLRTAHVQNPTEIEHDAGDVSKNGAGLNMSTQHARIAELEAQIEALSGVQALSAAPAVDITTAGEMQAFEAWYKQDCVIEGAAAKMAAKAAWKARAMLAASPTPPAEQATKETSGGFHVWRDISTAPKDGSRFVATGHNYGLYGEVRHTCVAQWFLGCWMEASDWNETSELKYLTHWMPLPSPPDDVAAPAEQQAAPKAAPEVGNSGFDYKTAADFLNDKTVSDEAVRKFVAASRWAHDERASLSAMLLSVRGELASREAEIALLKKALLEAEAAPQQDAQEPAAVVVPCHTPSGKRVALYSAKQDLPIGTQLYTAPQPSPTTKPAPQPAPAPLSEMPYEKRKAIQEGEQISASDAWFHARFNMLDTLDRRNVFRAGFDRGWNAALAAQGGK